MMLTAVTCALVILGCGSTSARALGGDKLAKEMYQQWEHEAVRTSRSLMTALSPAGDHKTQCNKLDTWLYDDTVCQPEGGNNVTITIQPNSCFSLKDLELTWGVSAYKYGSPPKPDSLTFFPTSDCSGSHKSHGTEGLKGASGAGGMQAACPECSGTNPVNGWNYGNFEALVPDSDNTEKFDFNKNVQSVWFDCATTSTGSS